MFRVICISNNWDPAPEAAHEPRPDIGDIDTVVKDFMFCGGLYYELERFPEVYYGAKMFAILPDQSAEVVEEELVNLQPA